MLLLLAILPCVVLFFAVWAMKKGEKPPKKLLLCVFLFGALTVVSATVIGLLGEVVVEDVLLEGSLAYLIIDNLLLTAVVEEGGKYFVLKKTTWKNPGFRGTYDAVIFAVTASLGFAAVENIVYVLDGSMSDAVSRAVLSVPGHACYGVFMGCFYARAKVAQAAGEQKAMKRELRKAFWIPVLLHGAYDLCIDLIDRNDLFLYLLILFCIELTATAVRRVRRLSREDMPLRETAPAEAEAESERPRDPEGYAENEAGEAP